MEGEVHKDDHCSNSEEILQQGHQLHSGGGEKDRKQKHTLDWE